MRSDAPQVIRALLSRSPLTEEREAPIERVQSACRVAADALGLLAPPEWILSGYPVDEDGETTSIQWAADLGNAVLDLGEAMGSTAFEGRVRHLAHLMKAVQLPEGCWPVQSNARTGAPVGPGRCAAEPLLLFNRLDSLQDSTEFETAASLAAAWLVSGG